MLTAAAKAKRGRTTHEKSAYGFSVAGPNAIYALALEMVSSDDDLANEVNEGVMSVPPTRLALERREIVGRHRAHGLAPTRDVVQSRVGPRVDTHV